MYVEPKLIPADFWGHGIGGGNPIRRRHDHVAKH